MSEFYKHIHGSALLMPALAELSTGQPSDWEAEGESKWGFLNEPRVDVEASQTAMIRCRGESSGAERSGESKRTDNPSCSSSWAPSGTGKVEGIPDSLQKGGVVGKSRFPCLFLLFCCSSHSNSPINVGPHRNITCSIFTSRVETLREKGGGEGGGNQEDVPAESFQYLCQRTKKEKRQEAEVSPDVAQRAPGGGPD